LHKGNKIEGLVIYSTDYKILGKIKRSDFK
jgi:hypothetical protein